ncbi:hypothetical protein CFOLD11_12040 [Clostridium folliculivorans]|uniref:Uncharacterized protein n=1 Tax=Clostridium folliculivorans TaxID=2886038 RepID=A0A9W6DA73_9CLOT|nr:hypothetical protein [Clostridium folliculivorans]GKU24378.1 hypothetical protein CFOLD11_12040 [Clostridium folliculivorans]
MFNIEAIVEYLLPFALKIEKLFNWDTPKDKDVNFLKENGIISSEECQQLQQIESSYEKNVAVKLILSSVLDKLDSIQDRKLVYKWIVSNWGGINSINVEKLNSSVEQFLKQRAEGSKYAKIESRASVTKVLSFIDPEKYIIYDTRVAYSINWILLKTNSSKMFFPMSEGRNSKLRGVNIETLIRLSRASEYLDNLNDKKVMSKVDKKIFIDDTLAYPMLCDLIAAINHKLWSDERTKYPFYTEMLLFAIADNIIFEDVLKTCSMKF